MRYKHVHTQKTKRRSILFFETGLIVALSFSLWAFNISSETSDIVLVDHSTNDPWASDTLLPPVNIEKPKPTETGTTTKSSKPSHKFKVVNNTTPTPEPVTPKPRENPIGHMVIKGPNLSKPVFSNPKDEQVVLIPGEYPEFPGGLDALMGYLSKNIEYPPLARENNIQGRLVLSFIIEKDGSISHIEVLRSLGWGCDEEAIRVIQSMPRWTPGKNNGNPVRVRMNLPVKFMLQ